MAEHGRIQNDEIKKKILQYSTVENIAAAISGASAHGALTASLRSTDQLPHGSAEARLADGVVAYDNRSIFFSFSPV